MSTTIATGSAREGARGPRRSDPRWTGPTPWAGYGTFGGRFVPETLMDALDQLAEAYAEAKADPAFQTGLMIT